MSGHWIELLERVATEKAKWQDAELVFLKAKAELDYAEQSLKLARDRFVLDWERDPGDSSSPIPHDLWNILNSVRLLGFPAAEACKRAVETIQPTTSDEIAEWIEDQGYRFTSSAPAREVNAALIKQPSVARDANGKWVWVDDTSKPLTRRERIG